MHMRNSQLAQVIRTHSCICIQRQATSEVAALKMVGFGFAHHGWPGQPSRMFLSD